MTIAITDVVDDVDAERTRYRRQLAADRQRKFRTRLKMREEDHLYMDALLVLPALVTSTARDPIHDGDTRTRIANAAVDLALKTRAAARMAMKAATS